MTTLATILGTSAATLLVIDLVMVVIVIRLMSRSDADDREIKDLRRKLAGADGAHRDMRQRYAGAREQIGALQSRLAAASRPQQYAGTGQHPALQRQPVDATQPMAPIHTYRHGETT